MDGCRTEETYHLKSFQSSYEMPYRPLVLSNITRLLDSVRDNKLSLKVDRRFEVYMPNRTARKKCVGDTTTQETRIQQNSARTARCTAHRISPTHALTVREACSSSNVSNTLRQVHATSTGRGFGEEIGQHVVRQHTLKIDSVNAGLTHQRMHFDNHSHDVHCLELCWTVVGPSSWLFVASATSRIKI